MTVRNLLYHGVVMYFTATGSAIAITLYREWIDALRIKLDGKWVYAETGKPGDSFTLRLAGERRFRIAR